VFQLRHWRARGGAAPSLPPELSVPPALDPEGAA